MGTLLLGTSACSFKVSKNMTTNPMDVHLLRYIFFYRKACAIVTLYDSYSSIDVQIEYNCQQPAKKKKKQAAKKRHTKKKKKKKKKRMTTMHSISSNPMHGFHGQKSVIHHQERVEDLLKV